MRHRTLSLTFPRSAMSAPRFETAPDGEVSVFWDVTGTPVVKWVWLRGSRRDARRRHNRKMKRR